MNLIIYNNEEYEEESALFDLNTDRVILKGDSYHDKIDDQIVGYLKALRDFSIYTRDVDSKWIDRNHEHFEVVDFYYEYTEEPNED